MKRKVILWSVAVAVIVGALYVSMAEAASTVVCNQGKSVTVDNAALAAYLAANPSAKLGRCGVSPTK